MTERKTRRAAAKATALKAAATKKVAAKKVELAEEKREVFVDAENAGFRAGDVYQALYAAQKSLSVEELEAATGKSEVEVLLGIGWLLKEGKVKGDAGKVVLA